MDENESEQTKLCWWCMDIKTPALYLVNTVPICRDHIFEAVDHQVFDVGGADVRPLDWEPNPHVHTNCPLF